MMRSTPLSCAEAFERLDDYLDRELDPAELADVEAHLALCAACADEFAVERELLEEIRAKLRHLRMPADLLSRISQRLAQE